MGSCISKSCRPKKKFKAVAFSHVQDKLVICQEHVPPKMTATPSGPTTSSTSNSSYSCSTDPDTSKCTTESSVSCSSSLLSSKDRSFSDEFLWSCVKENPQVISIREKQFPTANKVQYHQPLNLNPLLLKTKSMNHVPMPKKRARANSPILTRQKSFRTEQDQNPGLPNWALRSPSPSRRFNNRTNEYNSRIVPVFKGNGSLVSGPKRESFRAPPTSPIDSSIGRNSPVRKRETLISKQVSTKIDDHVAVGDSKDVVMEDIDNPLIALDCFIFL